MKRNLTVLVLLVTWSLFSIPTPALAGNDVEMAGGSDPSEDVSPDLIVHVTGAADDDTGGDPGDAGDGYGFTDPDLMGGVTGDCDGADASFIEEYLNFLMSLVQLAL